MKKLLIYLIFFWVIMDKYIDKSIVYYTLQNEETLERKLFYSRRYKDTLFLIGDRVKIIKTTKFFGDEIINKIERIK